MLELFYQYCVSESTEVIIQANVGIIELMINMPFMVTDDIWDVIREELDK